MKLDTAKNASLSLNRVVGAKVMKLSSPPTCKDDYEALASAIAAGDHSVPGFTEEFKGMLASKTSLPARHIMTRLQSKRQDSGDWSIACSLRSE
jgi:hypothetical protein